ncbi:NAD-dependent succinate-semialdehyde dehydrogenase [Coraliomargarita sp. SDUM461004]|uniref:NAD-dependent succinate-semialdehyde dehydrogenase n=1 Tax=Thalassobacterium sedimentorum TaxID=3041258 RepID=A0ABU1ALX0_9BACT|nr:NAD-dependent succinate-semialdehyde dehydrogenase [Coraliomargarita sp. SDUM461004]MDQ8195712.1 NAD-dependent succinate-semialdehyde dehydrogenase [Coraliomargarita sp. SDUM461004]
MSIVSINPATEETLKTYQPMTKDQALAAVQVADTAYQDWKNRSFSERRQIMLRLAQIFRERTDEFAQLITLEMGKRIEESRAEIQFCAEITEFYAEGAADFLADEDMAVEDADAQVQYAPIGVLLGVMPWNFPFYQVIRFIAPNLMAGNTTLVRHASNVPQCAEKIEELLQEAGLPAAVFTNLRIPHEFVKPIIESPQVRGVSLTGSERAGSTVASLAAAKIKPTVLELGGNDPFIVLEDADVAETVKMAVKGRMVNTGQSCVGSKRFILVESVAEAFTAGFKQAMSELKMGDPMDPATEVGPLSTESAAVKLAKQVQDTLDAGATAILGGDRPDCQGAYYNPTILTDVTPEQPSYDQELFGPVATIYVVKDEQAALELANDSSYGLGGSIFTQDIARGRRLARSIDTGMVFINQPTNSQAELPFGGTKNSGYGRELSKFGIYEFVNKKLIHSPKM